MKQYALLALIAATYCWAGCKSPAPGLFGKRTPHEMYSARISDAGLEQTALGRLWKAAAAQSLSQPVTVNLPYSEEGYFSADKPLALGLRFIVKRGEKVRIALSVNSRPRAIVYLDLWEMRPDGPKALAAADTAASILEYEPDASTSLLVRMQPELLTSGDYTLNITTGPSLAFPVQGGNRASIGSLWGADRDGGARRHEGIDIFGKKRTPLLAVAPGTVNRVESTNLGGKVVWLRPEGKDYSVYYAHLDEQLVRSGQRVQTGDTVGLLGNTGNAKHTAPHLHFGIYTFGGAVDPLPFVNPLVKTPPRVTGSPDIQRVRTKAATTKIYHAPNSDTGFHSVPQHTFMSVQAAMAGYYRVSLPDGREGYVNTGSVVGLGTPLRQLPVKTAAVIREAPDSLAPRKLQLAAGTKVAVLASYNRYHFVQHEGTEGWIEL
ncbi:M23 family metallopeptidase [Chitinophaga horti]|uniref:M23 family metallopeptidase n=1 Tax=Chitinophaga horti TaxID=2920382 RepID=A0ABY6IUG3_9BACT|nr:M23 family metallopeptidase [Chitinophaga horti]UYQ91013.1 M23 family metallopeptidase [Chitinophaga horti]